jgi:preprotein translocase subunit YajC
MGQQGDLLGMLLPLVVFVVIFYFLLIRPQKKKQKQHETMLASIHRGDDVVTAGGFFGTVREVKDDSFILEIAEGVKARILKSSISYKRSAGEGKAADLSPEATGEQGLGDVKH